MSRALLAAALLLSGLAQAASCGGQPGRLSRRDGSVLAGKVRLDPCRDQAVAIADEGSGRRFEVPFSEMQRLAVGGDAWIALDAGAVRDPALGVRSRDRALLVRVLSEGPASLYELCEIAWAGSGLRRGEAEVLIWILGIDGRYWQVPVEPPKFLALAEKVFAGDEPLLREIRAASWTHRVPDPRPGGITSVESVGREQLVGFVRRHRPAP